MTQEKAQPKKNFVSHTIIYPIEPDAIDEEIKSIRLIGEFGTWSGWIDMKKSEDGQCYKTDIFVHPGTTICYKYLINGHIWSTDLSPDSTSIKGKDGHLMVVKKIGGDGKCENDSLSIQFEENLDIINEDDDIDESNDNDNDNNKANENKKVDEPVSEEVMNNQKEVSENPKNSGTTTTTNIPKTKGKKGEKKTPGCFKKLFSCF